MGSWQFIYTCILVVVFQMIEDLKYFFFASPFEDWGKEDLIKCSMTFLAFFCFPFLGCCEGVLRGIKSSRWSLLELSFRLQWGTICMCYFTCRMLLEIRMEETLPNSYALLLFHSRLILSCLPSWFPKCWLIYYSILLAFNFSFHLFSAIFMVSVFLFFFLCSCISLYHCRNKGIKFNGFEYL